MRARASFDLWLFLAPFAVAKTFELSIFFLYYIENGLSNVAQQIQMEAVRFCKQPLSIAISNRLDNDGKIRLGCMT